MLLMEAFTIRKLSIKEDMFWMYQHFQEILQMICQNLALVFLTVSLFEVGNSGPISGINLGH